MPYIRLSMLTPRSGQEGRAAQMLEELVAHHRDQPGCRVSYALAAVGASGRAGRMAVWDDEQCANAAAATAHDLALRSELSLLIVPGSQEERAFDASDGEAGRTPSPEAASARA